MKVLNKIKLLIGKKVQFSDGAIYEKEVDGSLRRVPTKPDSREDRRREKSKENRRADLKRLGRKTSCS